VRQFRSFDVFTYRCCLSAAVDFTDRNRKLSFGAAGGQTAVWASPVKLTAVRGPPQLPNRFDDASALAIEVPELPGMSSAP
jgi:hypothetical protein